MDEETGKLMLEAAVQLRVDALILLSTANRMSHTTMWQNARKKVLANAASLSLDPGTQSASRTTARIRELAKEGVDV